MKTAVIVLAVAAIVALITLACCALSWTSLSSIKKRANAQNCQCTAVAANEDCDFLPSAKTGFLTSLISLVMATIGLILILVVFANISNPHTPK